MPLPLQEKADGYQEKRSTLMFLMQQRALNCLEIWSKWFTHNEPIVPVEGGYLYQFHYPNHINMKEAVQVGYHENLASAKVIKAYHEGDMMVRSESS